MWKSTRRFTFDLIERMQVGSEVSHGHSTVALSVVHDENSALRAENSTLKASNTLLERQNASAEATNKFLMARVNQVEAERSFAVHSSYTS